MLALDKLDMRPNRPVPNQSEVFQISRDKAFGKTTPTHVSQRGQGLPMPKPKPQPRKKPKKSPAAGTSRSTAKTRKPRKVAAGKSYVPTTWYWVWRYFKRGSSLRSLPSTLLPKILELTEFENLDAVDAELSQHKAFELPDDLQERLANLFDIRINPEEWNSYILPLKFEAVEFELPFPFKATPDIDFTTQNSRHFDRTR